MQILADNEANPEMIGRKKRMDKACNRSVNFINFSKGWWLWLVYTLGLVGNSGAQSVIHMFEPRLKQNVHLSCIECGQRSGTRPYSLDPWFHSQRPHDCNWFGWYRRRLLS